MSLDRNFLCRLAVVTTAVALLPFLLSAPRAEAAFGLSEAGVSFTGSDGSTAMQAGSHPFAFTTNVGVNTVLAPGGGEVPDGAVKDLAINFPPGFVGTPNPVPPCAAADFARSGPGHDQSDCPLTSVVGVARISVGFGPLLPNEPAEDVPVFNLVAPPGVASKIGFIVKNAPVTIETGVSPNPPYNLVTHVTNIPNFVRFFRSKLTLWGVPASPAHDGERGPCSEGGTKICPVTLPEVPFFTLPTTCAGPLTTRFEADSWETPGAWTAPVVSQTDDGAQPPSPVGTSGCERLAFAPSITAQPTSRAGGSPTGLDFSLDVVNEGLTNPEGIAGSDVEKTIVTLPEGLTVNPSIAEGLNVCTEADLAREAVGSEAGEGCPQESKIGTVEVETPLLEENVNGTLYQATPYENPFGSLVTLYMVLRNRPLGILIKQPIKVEPDPSTGQLTAIAEELPQLPFSHFRLHFREGTHSPLATPVACGTYHPEATLYPYSGGPPVTSSSAFEIISGPNNGPCPSGGTPPFHPGLIAGTLNNAAGAYSPFDLRLFRNDSEQEMTHFSIKLPPGVTGKLAGIPFCSDLQIAAAKARERTPHGGSEELAAPSCPAASEIGTTLVGAGVGPSLTYVPGKVYLAGPYHGSNLSIVAITAAKAGPFDLGTVVIREALKVDPETAEVSVDAAGSDPIPHIVEGIPVHARDIRVYVDRPGFVLNPTDCKATSTASTVLGSGTDFASEADDRPVTVTTRFQAADCASLGFGPRIKLMLKGQTKRTGLPRLKAVVRPRPGDANIGRAVVTLPRSEFLEQGHIGNSCTRVQFNSGAGNGAGCPANSVLGHAVAWTPLLSEPLEGPVFLRSNGGERKLPDLVAALHSKDIDIDLVGFIKSLHPKGASFSRIRSIFASVPDAPVSRFVLEMFGGRKGLLINSVNLCKGKHRAITTFVGQNGKRSETRPAVRVRCGRKKRHHKKSHGHSRHTSRANAWRGGPRSTALPGRRLP